MDIMIIMNKIMRVDKKDKKNKKDKKIKQIFATTILNRPSRKTLKA